MFTRVSYVVIHVHDVPGMVSFWRDKVGLKPAYKTSVWTEFHLENIILALLYDHKAIPKRTGIVFKVDNIQEAVEKLRANGVKVRDIEDIGFGLLSFFEDPEGNEYEIFQPR